MSSIDPQLWIDRSPAYAGSFRFDAAEFLAASRSVLRNRETQPWLARLVWTSLLACYAVFSLIWVDDRGTPGALLALALFGSIGFLRVAAQHWLVPLLTLRSAAAHLRPGESIALELTRDRVRCDWGRVATELGWERLLRAVETDRFFLLYLSRANALYLPKRVMTTAQQEEVRELLRERMSTSGGVQAEPVPPRAGRLPRVAIGMAAVWTLLMLGLARAIPDEVFAGAELPDRFREALHEEGYLDPGEEVLLFYSSAVWSVLDDGNLLTDRRVVSFWRAGDEVHHAEVPYERIYQMELFESEQGEPSRIQIQTSDGETLWLVATPTEEGDKRFFERLKSEWRKRVPEGEERYDLDGAPVEADAWVG